MGVIVRPYLTPTFQKHKGNDYTIYPILGVLIHLHFISILNEIFKISRPTIYTLYQSI